MSYVEEYKRYPAGSEELVALIVEHHLGWATSIAKSVARAWRMDWQLDGLDGGAYEALLFCAGRYDPARGIPFRGYARRRIHESSTEEARKSKSWQRGTGTANRLEQESRQISARLFEIFPELREGFLPSGDAEEGEMSVSGSIRELLSGAAMVAAFRNVGTDNPEIATEYKRLAEILSELEVVHQEIIWEMYYNGLSMRSIADDWSVDDLSVIREHKVLLEYLADRIEGGKAKRQQIKPRRGLNAIVERFAEENKQGSFSSLVNQLLLLLALVSTIHAVY